MGSLNKDEEVLRRGPGMEHVLFVTMFFFFVITQVIYTFVIWSWGCTERGNGPTAILENSNLVFSLMNMEDFFVGGN